MTAAELAFDIIRRSNGVQATKYAPRGPKADAVTRFMGRPAAHELFITEAQAQLFARLMGQNTIIAVGTGNDRFAAFVKDIYSAAKNRTFYLLTFAGFIPPEVKAAPEPYHNYDLDEELRMENEYESRMERDYCPESEYSERDWDRPAVVTTDRANDFAASLIRTAVAKGFAKADDRAQAGENYLCTWTTKQQAETLFSLLPSSCINQRGQIITQACGVFCYWTKAKAASGAVLLCWMGEVAGEAKPAPKPVQAATKAVPVVANGKRIPMDMDIPF